MARIRVNPEDLLNQAHEIAGLCISVMNEANRVLKISRSAPPYNGQFGPIVRAIGDSAHSLGRIRSESVKETGIRLTGISEAFIEVDNFAIYSDSLKNMCFDNEYDVYYTEEEKRIRKLFPNWVKGRDPDPGTDAFLAWAVAETSKTDAFRIIQVGENEWTVLISPTRGDVKNFFSPETYCSWKNVIAAKLGLKTEFEHAILSKIYKTIPDGDKINIVGYSQGGMIAYNMYEDLKDYYNIGSYTTFGSPIPNHVELPPRKICRNYKIGDNPLTGDPIPGFSNNIMNLIIGTKAFKDNDLSLLHELRGFESDYITIQGEQGDFVFANHYIDNYINDPSVKNSTSGFSFGKVDSDPVIGEYKPYNKHNNHALSTYDAKRKYGEDLAMGIGLFINI